MPAVEGRVVLVDQLIDRAHALGDAAEVRDEQRVVVVLHELVVVARRVDRGQLRTQRLDLAQDLVVGGHRPVRHQLQVAPDDLDALGEHRDGRLLRAQVLRQRRSRVGVAAGKDVSHMVDGDALRLDRVDLVRHRDEAHCGLLVNHVYLRLVDQNGQVPVAGRHGLRRVEQHVQEALGDLAEGLMKRQILRQNLRPRRVPAEHVVLREGLLVLLEPRAQVLGVGARLAGGIRRHLHLERVGDLHVATDLLAEQRTVHPRARPPATLRPRSRKVVGDVDDD